MQPLICVIHICGVAGVAKRARLRSFYHEGGYSSSDERLPAIHDRRKIPGSLVLSQVRILCPALFSRVRGTMFPLEQDSNVIASEDARIQKHSVF